MQVTIAIRHGHLAQEHQAEVIALVEKLHHFYERLGGLTVGRGYDPAALLGDKGVSGAFEVRYGPMQLHPKIVAAPYAFFDAGRVSNNNASASGLAKNRTLKSVGAGVVFRVFNRANLEVTYAHPIDSTRAGGQRPSDRVLVQLTASLL